MNSGRGFETRAIHDGQPPDPSSGAVVTPISLATTFAQESPGKLGGFEYSRTGNPTRTALEIATASLENARHGFAFASGMAATDAILRRLGPGDHLLLPTDAYGGTFRLVDKILKPMGIDHTVVDFTDLDALAAAWQPSTRLVLVETPTNPRLTIVDIAAIAALTRERDGICVVDNTFATPYLQRPIDLGATVVIHSATKYLGGHSDVVGGIALTSDDHLAEHLAFVQNGVGAVPSPFDAYLVLRGLKTLAVRMDRHCHNARAVVDLLVGHDAVDQVLYPGLADHPGHEIAARQMSDFGGMVSFVLGDVHAARRVTERVELFTLAESLGAVESLIEVPALMTHLSTEGSDLEVPGGLVRLSVGIESTDDLVADLAAALA